MHSIIGHRGAITYAVENTISSIYAVKALNHNWIEADVLLTKDKVPIMFHDETLDRLTDTTGNINSYNYDELKNIKLKNTKNKIPLLSEFVEKCDKLKINIMLELKTCYDEYELVNKVVEIIKKFKNIIIITCSYSKRILAYLNLLYPNNSYTYKKIKIKGVITDKPEIFYPKIKQ